MKKKIDKVTYGSCFHQCHQHTVVSDHRIHVAEYTGHSDIETLLYYKLKRECTTYYLCIDFLIKASFSSYSPCNMALVIMSIHDLLYHALTIISHTDIPQCNIVKLSSIISLDLPLLKPVRSFCLSFPSLTRSQGISDESIQVQIHISNIK